MERESDELDDEQLDELGDVLPDATHRIALPPCELSKLEEISELFSSVLLTPVQREGIANAFEQENYIKKLLDLFHMCEDLDNMEGLHHLYEIFRSIFLLNKSSLFEIMFTEENIFDVVGVLEYNPLLPQPAKHREYLRTRANFKKVIPLNNTELEQKIHQTYRVQYIQDVIMPMPLVFEENMLSKLTSLVYFNKMEIVTMIQEDEKFLQCLFTQLIDDETDDSKRLDLILFLKEFCSFSQTLLSTNRDNFFKTLSNIGILSSIEIILGLDDEKMKSAAIDIFSYIVEYSPSMVREYALQEAQTNEDVHDDFLMNLVIEQLIADPDPELGGAVQLMSIIRMLIDPENMLGTSNATLGSTNKMEKTEFLAFFYKYSMHVLTAPLFANTVEEKPSKDDFHMAQLLSLILELLTFCIEHHTYHIKNYVLNKNLVRRVLVLLGSKHHFLALSALRLLRKVVGLKDDFYYRYIIKGDLFKPVVDAYTANGSKYNLLNSAMIELFEFIKEEDIESLISYIMENHIKAFDNVDYVQTFKKLRVRYEQQQESPADRTSLDSIPSIMRNNRLRREPRAIEFDQISKYLRNRTNAAPAKELEVEETPTRIYNRTGFKMNINRSPPSNNPTPTPATSPIGSPNNSPTINLKPYSPPAAEKAAVVQTEKLHPATYVKGTLDERDCSCKGNHFRCHPYYAAHYDEQSETHWKNPLVRIDWLKQSELPRLTDAVLPERLNNALTVLTDLILVDCKWKQRNADAVSRPGLEETIIEAFVSSSDISGRNMMADLMRELLGEDQAIVITNMGGGSRRHALVRQMYFDYHCVYSVSSSAATSAADSDSDHSWSGSVSVSSGSPTKDSETTSASNKAESGSSKERVTVVSSKRNRANTKIAIESPAPSSHTLTPDIVVRKHKSELINISLKTSMVLDSKAHNKIKLELLPVVIGSSRALGVLFCPMEAFLYKLSVENDQLVIAQQMYNLKHDLLVEMATLLKNIRSYCSMMG